MKRILLLSLFAVSCFAAPLKPSVRPPVRYGQAIVIPAPDPQAALISLAAKLDRQAANAALFSMMLVHNPDYQARYRERAKALGEAREMVIDLAAQFPAKGK
jgi:hypothetical protein